MAKTNFTKVEEALVAGLHQITVTQLIEMADAVSEQEAPVAKNTLATLQKTLLTTLHQNIKRLHKKDPEIYQKLGLSRSYLKKLLETPTSLSSEEWERLKQLKTKLDPYLEELPTITDEQIVKQERIRHINKRFNVNEKWLPLQ